MPGFNQRGPQGQGPMTGRGQGVCQNPNMAGNRAGAGYAAGGGGRGCRRGGGRGFGGRGDGLGRGYAAAQAQAPAYGAGPDLQERARILEEELNAVKAQLNTMSEKE